MRYRRLGNSGIEVSEIGLGAWQIGGPLRAYFAGLGWISHGWGHSDDAEAVRLIHACEDMGINFIDTAAGYGAGHSERVIGRAMKGRRDQWIIETKGGEGFSEDNVNYKDFSRPHLLKQINESLTRLQTDYVDVYLLHNPSWEDLEKGECLQVLADIQAAGKARLVGVSIGSADMGLRLIELGAVDALQVPINIANPAIAERLFPAASKAGVGIVARGAFGAGFFVSAAQSATYAEDDRRSWQSAASKARGAKVAQAFSFLEIPGRTLAQSYLKFLLTYPEISTIIAGSKTLAHMQENAGASDAPDFTPDELKQIEAARAAL